MPSGFIAALGERPESLSLASRYTVANGAFYLGFGALVCAWPRAAQTLFFERAFEADEGSLLRVIGLVVAFIGWFYVMGGRTGARSFVAATVVDRILLPFVLVPIALSGVFPHLLITFAALDPVLAIGAFVLLRRER